MDYLREHKFQFYVVPDTIAPMKVVIRGIPKSCKIENVQKEIFDSGFGVLKVVKMTSRTDAMVLSIF